MYVIYPNFKSVLSAPPARDAGAAGAAARRTGAKQRDYLLSPDAETILGELLPLYVRNAVYRALVEMTAAIYARAAHGDEERDRQRERHAQDPSAGRTIVRVRRTITQEIAEIVGGAAALQG